MKKIVILDRDGVVNYESAEFIKSPQEWQALPGSLEAIHLLNQAGFLTFIASNQSGVGRKLFTLETLSHIHEKMNNELKKHHAHIDGIYFCPHLPEHNCSCRKPKPGLLLQIQKDFNINLQEAIVIGDSWRDIQAGLAVQAKTILVLTGNGTKTLTEQQDNLKNTFITENLLSAVKHLLRDH